MPAIDIKFFHQPYFKFKNPEADKNFKSFSFEDTWKVKKVIEEIAKQIDETDLPETLKGGKNICLHDSKGRKCLGDIQIHEYLNKDLEINIDYENHVVLEFRQTRAKEGKHYSFVNIDTVLTYEKGNFLKCLR